MAKVLCGINCCQALPLDDTVGFSGFVRARLAYATTRPPCSRTAPRPSALASVCSTKIAASWLNCGVRD